MVGWLHSVHNTFLRCLRDASKLVCSVVLCFSPAYLWDAKSCGYSKTCNLFAMWVGHGSLVRVPYGYLEGCCFDSHWELRLFSELFLVVCNIYFQFQHTWAVGWLQSVHNTFLRCFHDASKLVMLLCFSLVYSQDAKSCGYPKTCNLLTMWGAHSSVVRAFHKSCAKEHFPRYYDRAVL